MERGGTFTKGIILSICVSCFVAFMSMIISLNYQKPASVESTDPYAFFTPRRYSISLNFDTPVRASEGHTWSSSLVSLVESYFRKQGISLGKINSTSYVQFSEQKLINVVNSHGFDSLFTGDFPAALIMEQIIANNLSLSEFFSFNSQQNQYVEMDVKAMNTASTVKSIKDLIFQTKRPLLLSMRPLQAKYFYKCQTEDCFAIAQPCPARMTERDYCGNITSETLLMNGQYFTPVSPAEPVLKSTYVNFVVEGFNDDYVSSLTIHSFSSMKRSKGGFFVRGFLGGNVGPMISRYEGNTDPVYADLYCLNQYFPSSWVAHNLSSEDQKQQPTYLTCIDETNEICINGHQYILIQDSSSLLGEASVTEDEDGLTYTCVLDLTQGGQIQWINRIPFWELSKVFIPSVILESDIDPCGHWFIPYDYIETILALDFNGVMVSDYHFKFASNAYQKDMLPLENTNSQRIYIDIV